MQHNLPIGLWEKFLQNLEYVTRPNTKRYYMSCICVHLNFCFFLLLHFMLVNIISINITNNYKTYIFFQSLVVTCQRYLCPNAIPLTMTVLIDYYITNK